MDHNTLWPNLFIPGAAKSGTSSLHAYLSQHPSIFMSGDKEPVFFSETSTSEKRKYYLRLFEKAGGYPYRGESSTAYMMSAAAVENIRRNIEDPRFIFLLRNPIDRAYSHYNWLKGSGFEQDTFEEAFAKDTQRAFSHREAVPIGDRSYYQEGCYSRWLSVYLAAFSPYRIHIMVSEALRAAPLATLNSCFEFLNLPALQHIQTIRQHETKMLSHPQHYQRMASLLSGEREHFLKGVYRKMLSDRIRISLRRWIVAGMDVYKSRVAGSKSIPPLTAVQRQWVAAFYADDVRRLKTLTGQDFPQWTDFK